MLRYGDKINVYSIQYTKYIAYTEFEIRTYAFIVYSRAGAIENHMC